MKYDLLLAWRYLRHAWGRSLVLALGIALTALLPLAVQGLAIEYSKGLAQRARATPLVAGAKGSRYDLVLSSLYFSGRTPETTSMAELEKLASSDLALVIPLLARSSARAAPLVGTSHDYYLFRGLTPAAGTLPLRLGDVVLGTNVALRLGLGPGGRLLSDQQNLYDLSKAYPLRMRVTGVLAETGTPDDDAVFVDLKTAWIVEGIGHGHGEARTLGEDQVLAREEDRVVLSAAVVEYTEITPENIATFHVHAAPHELPLTGILVAPHDAKASTLLKARYRLSETGQLLVPEEVISELLGFVFRLKLFFDANALLVGLATALFLGVVVLLSLEVRRGEMRTLARIGCARGTVARLFSTELALLVLAGVVLAGLLALCVWAFAPPLGELLA